MRSQLERVGVAQCPLRGWRPQSVLVHQHITPCLPSREGSRAVVEQVGDRSSECLLTGDQEHWPHRVACSIRSMDGVTNV